MSHTRISTALVLRRTAQVMLLPLCLAAATGLALLGNHFQAQAITQAQAIDTSRQVMFMAQNDGSVRALHLRNTVGELGVLRAPERRAVRDIALDASGQHLWVLGDDATYHYDAISLKLIQRTPLSSQGAEGFGKVSANDAELRPLLLAQAL